jgi:Mlc titration factor MtfA (ptsG expression regulator)
MRQILPAACLEMRRGVRTCPASSFQRLAVEWLIFAGLLLLAWFLAEPAWAAWRRRQLRRQTFPAAWRRILRRRVPLVRRLPPVLLHRLQRHILVFLAQTPIIGCAGQVVDDEVRVTIAAQAALLLLGRPDGRFQRLRQVLVYPGAFIVDRVRPDGTGVVQEQRAVLAGESWQQGQVILSWDDVLSGAAVPDDGRNVVIHEFAHQLDQETGHANGAPFLGGREQYRTWAQTMNAEFEGLRAQLAQGAQSLIDPYAATDPAEFFAVLSELFFELPAPLAIAHPALYEELLRYYRVDPRAW